MDAVRHGMHPGIGRDRKGTKNGRSKLNELEVRRIEYLANVAGVKSRDLAAVFNVGKSTIGNIKQHLSWKHLWSAQMKQEVQPARPEEPAVKKPKIPPPPPIIEAKTR